MSKVHNITSYFYDTRKILNQKFWSHGTPLGSMGPGSQQDPDEIFSKSQILVIWGPYGPNIPLAYETHAENLKPISIMMCFKQSHAIVSTSTQVESLKLLDKVIIDSFNLKGGSRYIE